VISVIISTYGGDEWRDLAWSRAHPSVPRAEPNLSYEGPGEPYYRSQQIIVVHGATLAAARNAGAEAATNPWLCFLDADDELAPGYLEAMVAAIEATEPVLVGLFTPAIVYVGAGGREEPPMFHQPVPIEDGNWLVIGTVIPRALFREVGGFEEFPKYEDWALFARLQKAGAMPVKVPDAVYRAHRNPRGRNHEGGTNAKREAHDMIRRAVFPELYP